MAFSTTPAPSEIRMELGRHLHAPTPVWYSKGIRQDLKTYPWTGGKYTPKTLLRRYDYTHFCANVVSERNPRNRDIKTEMS